jgi:hypothetical protein
MPTVRQKQRPPPPASTPAEPLFAFAPLFGQRDEADGPGIGAFRLVRGPDGSLVAFREERTDEPDD